MADYNAHYVQSYDTGDVLCWPCYVDVACNRVDWFGEQDSGTPFAEVPSYAMLREEWIEWPGGMRQACMKDAEYNDYYMEGQAAGEAAIAAEYGGETLILFDDGQIPG